MGSIGSINKPSKGFLVAAIQMPVPIINSRADIDKQVKKLFVLYMQQKQVILERN